MRVEVPHEAGVQRQACAAGAAHRMLSLLPAVSWALHHGFEQVLGIRMQLKTLLGRQTRLPPLAGGHGCVTGPGGALMGTELETQG